MRLEYGNGFHDLYFNLHTGQLISGKLHQHINGELLPSFSRF